MRYAVHAATDLRIRGVLKALCFVEDELVKEHEMESASAREDSKYSLLP